MATKFVENINPYLICPRCGNVFNEPVINIHCGHTLCKACFLSNDKDQKGDKSDPSTRTCPVDSVACSVDSLVVNRALLSQINDLVIYCKHGLTWSDELQDFVVDESGCPQQIPLGERDAHESGCEFALVPCPFNAVHCGLFRKKELQLHVETCTSVPCPYSEKGCGFVSSHEMTDAHAQSCQYRCQLPLNNESLVRSLQERNSALESVVGELRQQVAALQTQSTTLEGRVNQQARTIQTLEEKLDGVLMEVEKLRSPRRVPSVDSSHSAARSRTGSSSSLAGLHGGQSPRLETWTMPFQFKCIGTLRGHEQQVRGLVTRRNLLFSCADDNVIKVWDLEGLTRGCVKTLRGHKDGVQSLAAGNDYLYSGGQDGCIIVWGIADLESVKVIQNAHSNVVAALAASDEHLISSSHTVIKDRFYSGSHNTIEIWDCTGTFNLVGKITHSHGSVFSIALTAHYIIVGTYNQNVHVFDVNTQNYVRKLSGHLGSINSVLTSPSGRFLFTASKDTSIQIWNLENNLPIQNLQRHDGSVNSLVIHNDLLLSGSDDSEIKVFKYFKMSPGFTPS